MAHGTPEDRRPSYVIVKDTFVSAGRPRIRISRPLQHTLSHDAAVSAARTQAGLDPSRRFRLLRFDPPAPDPQVVWDSHPSS
jgi:hypothetical protein